MPFARISPFVAFPDRITLIDANTFAVAKPMTWNADEGHFHQQIDFQHVSDSLAKKLRDVPYRPAFVPGPDNPPRFEVVDDETQARAIEERDRARVKADARGRGYVQIGSAKTS